MSPQLLAFSMDDRKAIKNEICEILNKNAI